MVIDVCITFSSVEDAAVVRWLDGLPSTVDRDDLCKRLFLHGYDAARSLCGIPFFGSGSGFVSESSTNALQMQIDELRGTLAREREQFDSTLSLNVRLALAEDSASLRAAADTHRRAHADLVDALKALAEGESLRENDALRRRLTSLEVELSTIKRTNHGIGVEGEERVAMTLRHLFPHAEIVPKHSDGHCCDLWIEEDDMIIPVEVKNKRDITRADVDRFKKDVAGLVFSNGTRLAGALFISCRTPNIPGQGALRLVHEGDLPILFIGMGDNNSTDMMGSLRSPLELFMSVARRARLLNHHQDDPKIELKRILDERLAPMIERAKRVRQSLKEASIASAAALAAAEKELEALCALADIDLFDSSNNSNNVLKCAQCGRVCRSQHGLRAHVKACNGKKIESVQ